MRIVAAAVVAVIASAPVATTAVQGCETDPL